MWWEKNMMKSNSVLYQEDYYLHHHAYLLLQALLNAQLDFVSSRILKIQKSYIANVYFGNKTTHRIKRRLKSFSFLMDQLNNNQEPCQWGKHFIEPCHAPFLTNQIE